MTVDPLWTDEAWRSLAVVEAAGVLGEISLTQWAAIPEDVCRDHELDRGRLVVRQSGTPGHQLAARRIANAIEGAARKAVRQGSHRCLTVNQDLDVRLWEVPATVRRPDVLAYRCVEPGEDLWADVVLLAVEIVSPGSEKDDTGADDPRRGFQSKKSQYALAGIESYWVVWLRPDDSAVHRIQEWRLVAGLGEYKL